VFLASIANIEKALRKKEMTDPRTRLLEHFYEFLDVANRTKADELPPLRGYKVNYRIEL
jgi:hypothetical protein